MAPQVQLEWEIPPEVLEDIADRAAQLVESRFQAVNPWLNSAETAAYLRCPVSRVYALTSARRIPFHHDGSRLLFKRTELDQWVEEGGGRRP